MRRLQSNNFIQEKEKKGGILQNFLCPLNVYSGSLDSWNLMYTLNLHLVYINSLKSLILFGSTGHNNIKLLHHNLFL